MVPIDVVHIDIEILRCLAQHLRVLEIGAGAAEQQNGVAERHLGMGNTAVCVLEGLAGLAETESLVSQVRAAPAS